MRSVARSRKAWGRGLSRSSATVLHAQRERPGRIAHNGIIAVSRHEPAVANSEEVAGPVGWPLSALSGPFRPVHRFGPVRVSKLHRLVPVTATQGGCFYGFQILLPTRRVGPVLIVHKWCSQNWRLRLSERSSTSSRHELEYVTKGWPVMALRVAVCRAFVPLTSSLSRRHRLWRG